MKRFRRLLKTPPEAQRQQNLKNEAVAVRTTGRIKKPKAVFDPSDNNIPKARRMTVSASPSAFNAAISTQNRRTAMGRISTLTYDISGTEKYCIVCGRGMAKRPSYALKNPLIACLECKRKIHKLCLKVDYADFEQVRQFYRCENCTPCSICYAVEEELETLVCQKCVKVFHVQCLEQIDITENEDTLENWKCNKCMLDLEMSSDEELSENSDSVEQKMSNEKNVNGNSDDYAVENECNNGNNSQPELDDALTFGPKGNSPNNRNTDKLFNDIPDVRNWTADQVFEYFSEMFPKEAHVLKDNEIDGPALLLLKRSDVVGKLPLKLGPSLRLYNAILKIQWQHNDPTLGWSVNI